MVDPDWLDSLPPFPRDVPLDVLLVRHDASAGDYFPTSGDLNFNAGSQNPETENLYSRIGDLINEPFQFVSSDNLFHFRICYPGKHKLICVFVAP